MNNAKNPFVVPTTWRDLIECQMKIRDEAWADVVSCTLTDDELDVEFYDGFGSSRGAAFTLWTSRRVYFPVVWDGAEWCESVPRDPCEEKMSHVGGEGLSRVRKPTADAAVER